VTAVIKTLGKRKLYRLQWLTEGLQKEKAGEFSIHLFSKGYKNGNGTIKSAFN
jgi:hypothetical protein